MHSFFLRIDKIIIYITENYTFAADFEVINTNLGLKIGKLTQQTTPYMLLAKKKGINSFTTHANLISLHMEDPTAFEDYLNELISNVHKIAKREVSVYEVDRKMSRVVIHLAVHHGNVVPAKPANQYDNNDWDSIRGLLLDSVYA